MKKRILGIIAILALALGISALCVACNGKTEKADYSVTVLSPAEDPLSGITVSWMTGTTATGSAETDDDGKATASLPVGTYTVALAGYGDGLEYTSVSVSAAMRNVTLTLSVMRVNYAVTVTDKTGAPAKDVTVIWTSGIKIAGFASTNANGKAECELDYGEYTVTLSNLPDGNLYDGAVTVNGKNPSAEFTLHGGVALNYSVTVKSEGGLLFKNHPVAVNFGTTPIASGYTDDKGVFTFSAAPGTYTARITLIPQGYTCKAVNLSTYNLDAEIILYSEVSTAAPDANQTYVMGDILHDYTFTTPYELNGAVWSKSVKQILETKEMLIINNWGTNCSWCVQEMPAMQEVYEKYSDQIEIVAVSNYVPLDTDKVISNYYASHNYTFPMMRDTNGFSAKFGISNWPTTIVIDRYGAVARIEIGAVTSAEAWERMVLKYVGPDYVQSFTPGDKESESINTEVATPDIVLPDDHYQKLAQALNNTNSFPAGASVTWYGDTEYELAWPFMFGTVEGVSPADDVMYASNTGKANSMAIIYATVAVDAGKVLSFDYYADTEDGDVLYILWDGRIIKEIYGNSDGWKTCYLYSDITNGSHTLALTYIKDAGGNAEKDNVFFRNVRFVELSEITGEVNMLRSAAYGTPAANATTFPYYADVALEADGYYHVDLGTLENHELAGNDLKPLLLVNLLNVTPWSNAYSISQLVLGTDAETGEYMFDCTFEIDGVTRDYRDDLTEYLTAAAASDVADCVPVDKFLHDMLVAFMQKVSGSKSHPKEWLEACYFYSYYGDGQPIGNPVLGLMERTAIPVTEGTHTASLTRNMQPFPITIYSFTPETDAVYKIESLISDEDAEKYAAQIWLYDDGTDIEKPIVYSGDSRVTLGGVNEQNFEIYRYMKTGHKYYIALAFLNAETGSYEFTISNAGQTVTETIPCSQDFYNMILDEDENVIGTELAGAVEYVIDGDGYYHAKNPDGTTGDFIYLDVLNASTGALGTIPLNRLVDKYVIDPLYLTDLDYKFFDFRYCVMYYQQKNAAGEEITTYDPKIDISTSGAKYRDYTDILKSYIESAPTTGDLKGFVKVNQELVDILSLYIELRLNGVYNGKIEKALDNEWLRFCWYNRTYNENNP